MRIRETNLAKDVLALRLIDGLELLQNSRQDMNAILTVYQQGALATCHALAYTLKRNPGSAKDKKLLDKFVADFNLKEYCITDENGIVSYSNNDSIIGYNMASDPQSQEFLPALSLPDFELVQEVRPRGSDGKLYQYVGVSRRDQKGIVQIAYAPSHYQDVFSLGSLQRRLKSMRIGTSGFMAVVQNHKIVFSTSSKLVGTQITEYDAMIEAGDFFVITVEGTDYYACFETIGDMKLVGLLNVDEIHRNSGTCILLGICGIGVILLASLGKSSKGNEG